MSTKRIGHTAKFKFTIALEAIKSDKTINQLASEHQLDPSQISQWQKHLLEPGSDIFATPPTKRQRDQNDGESSLYEQMGRLNMELDWLKKKRPQTAEQRCKLVEPDPPKLSIRRQCEWLGFSGSTLYCHTASAQLETAPTKQENGSFVFLTAPVWRVSLILRSTIVCGLRSQSNRLDYKRLLF